MSPAPAYRDIGGLLAGFALWAAGFVFLYAGHGYACSSLTGGAPPAVTRPLLVGTLVLFVAAHLALAVWLLRRWRSARSGGSVRQLRLWAFILAAGATAATVWTGLPVLALSLCA
jgi:hypothetical protein